MNVLKRLILWEYPRMSWQYDVIVAAIVAFAIIGKVADWIIVLAAAPFLRWEDRFGAQTDAD